MNQQQLAQIIATKIKQQYPNQHISKHKDWIIIGCEPPWTYINLQDDTAAIEPIGEDSPLRINYADPHFFQKLHQHLQTLLT